MRGAKHQFTVLAANGWLLHNVTAFVRLSETLRGINVNFEKNMY